MLVLARTLAQFLQDKMDQESIGTVAGLAERIGVTPATAKRLLEGRGTPREETLDKIAESFHVPPNVVRDLVQPSSLAAFLMAVTKTTELSSTKKLGNHIGIAQGTAYRLSRGLNIPTQETLRKVSKAFGIPITEVERMADRPVGEAEPFTWPAELDQLTRPQREALVAFGRLLIDASGLGRVTR